MVGCVIMWLEGVYMYVSFIFGDKGGAIGERDREVGMFIGVRVGSLVVS